MWLRISLALLMAAPAAAAQEKRVLVLVVTAHAGDYLLGAGGTLAALIDQGHEVYVVQVTNDEKNSAGLGPAETQKANTEEGRQAARLLGARELLGLGHKAGELGQLSSTELREELFTLIRYFQPRILFIPDPYIHYDPDRDHFYVGKMAEEAWGYSGGGMFAPELARAGLSPYGAPEIYYYAAGRPYRPGEGGEGQARFRPVDIGSTFERKLRALLALKTTNRLYALQTQQRLREAGRSNAMPAVNEAATDALVRAFVEELAQTIGRKHGFRYGEEFNYVGVTGGLPEHILERAVPKP